ncbi:MAG: galactokinase family protein [Planctomycetota bacterium]
MVEKLDEQGIAQRLAKAGMRLAQSRVKAGLFADALRNLGEFRETASGNPYLVFVPGRIEVLGKHTDYAGGRSLLAAVERGFCATALPRQDATIQIVDASSGEKAMFEFSPDLTPTVGHWSNYPMTVARRLSRNFEGPLHGADIVMRSDLPPAAGMSSSSAMMIAVFKVLAQVNRLADRAVYREHLLDPPALAAYLATIENGQSFASLAGDRGVGTFGGSEDHTAMCCCQPGHLHVFSFCPARLEQVIAFPADYILVIASSGVLAEKTGEAMAKYNRASRRVSALLELWNTHAGRNDRCLADAARSAIDAPEQLQQIVTENPHTTSDAPALLRRFEHFLGENEQIIPAACAALAQGDIGRFGSLVDRSQHLAEELLQNQVPQTIYLARAARQCGAAAASAFGAGFGGSVWALVKTAHADEFVAAWADGYRRSYPAEAPRSSFFVSGAGTGLIELWPERLPD